MGRTNPTFRDTIRRFQERWQPFRRALRRQYQARFDALLEQGERFADAAGFQNPADADRAILVSMLLGQEADLHDLEARVAALEDRLDDDGRDAAGREPRDDGPEGGRETEEGRTVPSGGDRPLDGEGGTA